MRIATWNVERLKHKVELNQIVTFCEQAKADILVLTEADNRIALSFANSIATPYLSSYQGVQYNPTERAVITHSNYGIGKVFSTFNAFTAVCIEQNTELGNVLVYGVIIGRFGNRHPDFIQDLNALCKDIDYFVNKGYAVCVCGDFNLSFSDNYYFTAEGRRILTECFERNHIRIVTAEKRESVDHIAMSESFIENKTISIEEWNQDKSLSDHKGVVIEIE